MVSKTSGLKIFIQRNKIAAVFWIGAILILIGIGLSVYVDSVIKSYQEKLFSPFSNLTQQESAIIRANTGHVLRKIAQPASCSAVQAKSNLARRFSKS